MSSGAGMAIEDAAVLGIVLSRQEPFKRVDERRRFVGDRLELYQQARWARATEVQDRSTLNGRIWHCESLRKLSAIVAHAAGRLLQTPTAPIKKLAMQEWRQVLAMNIISAAPISGRIRLLRSGCTVTTQKPKRCGSLQRLTDSGPIVVQSFQRVWTI